MASERERNKLNTRNKKRCATENLQLLCPRRKKKKEQLPKLEMLNGDAELKVFR